MTMSAPRTVGGCLRLAIGAPIIIGIIVLLVLAGMDPTIAAMIAFAGIIAIIAIRARLRTRRAPRPPSVRIACPYCDSTRIKPHSWREAAGTVEREWRCDRCGAVFIPGKEGR